jgi:hypothetical protein
LPIYILPGLLPACVLQVFLLDHECLHNPCLSPACSLPHSCWVTDFGSQSPTHQCLGSTLTAHSNSLGTLVVQTGKDEHCTDGEITTKLLGNPQSNHFTQHE